MLHNELKRPFLLLFIGEIFAGIGSLSLIGSFIDDFGYVSFLGIIGFVITLIGIIRLRPACKAFRDVFAGVIGALGLYIVASVLAIIGGASGMSEKAADITLFFIAVAVLFAKVVQFYMIIRTIEGSLIVTKNEENNRLGKLAIKLFLIGLAITVICVLLFAIFQFAIQDEILLEIFIIFASVLSVASEVAYIIFLFNNYKSLE